MYFPSSFAYNDPYKAEQTFNETLEMELRFDDRNPLEIGDMIIEGRVVLSVGYDAGADDEYQYCVYDVLDLSGLHRTDEYGNETPLHMLVVRPDNAAIVEAINAGMEYHWNRLREK